MSIDERRPLPQPSELTEPFWAACRQHRLTVQRCRQCARYVFNPAPFCCVCLSSDLEWVESDGVGQVVTFTTVWRGQTPAFDVPYVVAVVRLDEGYEMMTNIVGADPTHVAIGDIVRVNFVEIAAGTTLPCFEVVR